MTLALARAMSTCCRRLEGKVAIVTASTDGYVWRDIQCNIVMGGGGGGGGGRAPVEVDERLGKVFLPLTSEKEKGQTGRRVIHYLPFCTPLLSFTPV